MHEEVTIPLLVVSLWMCVHLCFLFECVAVLSTVFQLSCWAISATSRPYTPDTFQPLSCRHIAVIFIFSVPQARGGGRCGILYQETFLKRQIIAFGKRLLFSSKNSYLLVKIDVTLYFWLELCSIPLSSNYSFGDAGVYWEMGTKSKRVIPSGPYVEALSEATDTEMLMLDFYLLVSFRYWYNVSSCSGSLNWRLNSIPLHGIGRPTQWIHGSLLERDGEIDLIF